MFCVFPFAGCTCKRKYQQDPNNCTLFFLYKGRLLPKCTIIANQPSKSVQFHFPANFPKHLQQKLYNIRIIVHFFPLCKGLLPPKCTVIANQPFKVYNFISSQFSKTRTTKVYNFLKIPEAYDYKCTMHSGFAGTLGQSADISQLQHDHSNHFFCHSRYPLLNPLTWPNLMNARQHTPATMQRRPARRDTLSVLVLYFTCLFSLREHFCWLCAYISCHGQYAEYDAASLYSDKLHCTNNHVPSLFFLLLRHHLFKYSVRP